MPAKRKVGRPRMPREETQRSIVTFRMQDREAKNIRKSAKTKGLKLSDWIRKVLLDAVGRGK